MKTKTKDRLLTTATILLMSVGGFCTSGCTTFKELSATEKWMIAAGIVATGAIAAHEADSGKAPATAAGQTQPAFDVPRAVK
jgi:hypothetical protein